MACACNGQDGHYMQHQVRGAVWMDGGTTGGDAPNGICVGKDGFEDPFPAHSLENRGGGRAITIDGESRFDIQLVRR
jgi:hypothetical protein